MINIKQQIKNPQEILTFNIESIPENLLIETKLSKESYVICKLFNPIGTLIGEIHYGYSNFINKIFISPKSSTINALAHPLMSGEYSLSIITLKEEDIHDLCISIDIHTNLINPEISTKFLQETPWFDHKGNTLDHKIINNECRYYKGDFHGHTNYSDGKMNSLQAINTMTMQELDFMALTEHNSIAYGFKETEVLMIPSFELTLPDGHINIHGIKNNNLFDTITSFEGLMNNTIKKYSSECNISINHMFLNPWHFTAKEVDIKNLNTIEIICDPTYDGSTEANNKAVAFLDFLWDKGYSIYGIGGSDSHNHPHELYDGSTEPSIYGDPCTYVYCPGLSIENIISGIKNGHCYVSRYLTLDISIAHDKFLPGDKISDSSSISYKVQLVKNSLNEPLEGRFIMNGKVISKTLISQESPTAILDDFMQYADNPYDWWLRFGLYNYKGDVLAYVNPVYNKKENTKNITLDKLIEEFNKKYD